MRRSVRSQTLRACSMCSMWPPVVMFPQGMEGKGEIFPQECYAS